MTSSAAPIEIGPSATFDDLKPLRERLQAGQTGPVDVHEDAPEPVRFAIVQICLSAECPLPGSGGLTELADLAGVKIPF
ncbi:hypothetical protein [Pseudoprimorskyibacter insulae]|uniref:hypothetical protein n=1 Tax=Pseudoprimorskyibacter insulae TaxID=1695997 RepID=UPI000D555724|nr:hypothetical protein [Pseudoprimorskyibacter insulae]